MSGDVHGALKRCGSCGRWKSLALFHPVRTRPDRLPGATSGRCRPCHSRASNGARERRKAEDPIAHQRRERDRALRRRYGITLAEYERRLAEQGDRCAICRTDDPAPGMAERYRTFVVDHDHESGDVRGLLCRKCNSALGLLADDPARMRAAANYVEGAALCPR